VIFGNAEGTFAINLKSGKNYVMPKPTLLIRNQPNTKIELLSGAGIIAFMD